MDRPIDRSVVACWSPSRGKHYCEHVFLSFI